ncbi:hypothetical protein [Candidatus Tremblaya phenacola]|uniref:hypothetical protein n=1 Tax=Candidatus Tremblayella phenacoccinincola TaxID=1010676 RepID=UPI00132FEC14|nr:hypothetical protein [Candidatus Tremblaya phenacola]
MYIPIPLSYPSKEAHSSSIRLTPLMTLQLLMKVFLTFLLKPNPETSLLTSVYILLARLLTLLFTSIESAVSMHYFTPLFGYPYVGIVGLVGLLTVGSMVLMWLTEHISMSGIGSGASLIILFRLLTYVPRLLLILKTTIDKTPTPSFLLLTDLSLLFYFSVLTELASQRLTFWCQKTDRIYSSCFSVSLVPVILFPLTLACVTSTLQVNFFEKICVACVPLYKWLCIQELIKAIEAVCEVLFHVSLMFYFCVIFTRWDVKANNVSRYMKRSATFIDSLRPGLNTKERLNYLFRELIITKSLCIVLGCAVIRLLSLFTKQVLVLNEFTSISLITTTLVLTEQLKFYANFIRFNKFFKTC